MPISTSSAQQPLALLRRVRLLRRVLSERRDNGGAQASAPRPAVVAATANGAGAAFATRATSADPLGPLPNLPQRRVVVTGIGIVSPLGVGTTITWDRILKGDSAVRALTPEDLAPPGGGGGLSSGGGGVGGGLSPPSQAVFESLPSRVGACVPRDELHARAREAAEKAADSARERQREFGSCAVGSPGPPPAAAASSSASAASSSSPAADAKAVAAAAERALASFDPRRAAPFMLYALVAAQEAMDDAQWRPLTAAQRAATAVFIGAGMPAAAEIAAAGAAIAGGRVRRVSPFFVPRILPNMAAGAVAIAHGLRGPNHAASTACATGLHAVGDAFRLLQRGEAAVALAGATEAAVDAVALGGFARLKGLSTAYTSATLDALARGGLEGEGAGSPRASPKADDNSSNNNNDPAQHPAASDAARSSRPFDRDRDGFVLGEGAAVLVLEDLEHARRRGARAYAEVRGYGLSGDACHVTQPHARGLGAALAMRRALSFPGGGGGGIGAGEADRRCVRHINAHATSTPMGDAAEALAIARVFGGSDAEACGNGEADEDAAEYLSDMMRGGGGGGRPVPSSSSGGLPLSPLPGLPPLGRVAVSSTKGATGHLLGAAGAVEAAFTTLSVARRVAPPTANLDAPDALVAARLPLLVGDVTAGAGGGGAGTATPGLVRGPYALDASGGGGGPVAALCNSFGFGGTNASVLFSTPPEDVARR